MRIGSLFSGAGGLDMAVGSVFGAETVWHCELDSAASKVLAHRWPGVPNLGSITEVDWAAVEPVDVLCGGFPCQDISSAGKQAGMGVGTRSGLWSEFARAIDALRPSYVVIENVRNLLSVRANRAMESDADDMGDNDSEPVLRGLGAVLGDLADIGFDADWSTVSASSVGAPHRRERVFVVAYPQRGTRGASAGFGARSREASSAGQAGVTGGRSVLPTGFGFECQTCCQRGQFGTSGQRDAYLLTHAQCRVVAYDLLPTPMTVNRTSKKAQTGRPTSGPQRGGPSYGLEDVVTELLPTPRTSDTNGAGLHGNGGPEIRTTVAMLCTPAASDGEGGKTSRSGARIDEPLLGGQAREMDGQQWGKYAPAIARWEAVTRPAPSPTEPNKNGNPRLSAAFSEWLLGWPDGWVTAVPGISRNDQLRIIGNGVVPQQATVALSWLLEVAEVAA